MSEQRPAQHAGPQGGGRQNRRLKNFLLDARFQLKFAAYFVAMTLVVAGLLGVFLARTTGSLFAQMNNAVESREKAAEQSRELGTCTLNSDLAKNMDDPEFIGRLAEKSKAIDDAFEAEKQAVLRQRAELERQQRMTLYALIGFLGGFIVLVAIGAIVITHRIVGPLFRIKRMAREVASGIIRPPSYGLRPGDELQDVFEAMALMIKELRERTEADLKAVEAAAQGDPAALGKLKDELQGRLAK
jgi:nitrogen fixation/metabolism regulation signal transduction histidine kinase